MVCRLANPARPPEAKSVPHQKEGSPFPEPNAFRDRRKKSTRLGTVADLCDAWAEAHTEATRKTRRRVARDLKRIAGTLQPREITALHWQSLVNQWRATLASSTVWTYRCYLANLARFIGKTAAIQSLDADVPKVRMPAPRTVVLTPAEISLLFANAPPWFRVFLTIGTALGLRHAEILDVKPEGFNPEKHTVSFVAKGGEVQSMPTTEEVEALFVNAPPGAPMTPLIELYKGSPVNRNSTWWEWQKTVRKSGIQKQITVHDLRRTLAVASYELTRDLRFVWQVLRHKSLGTTARYLEHVDRDAIRPILQDLWKPKGGKETVQ